MKSPLQSRKKQNVLFETKRYSRLRSWASAFSPQEVLLRCVCILMKSPLQSRKKRKSSLRNRKILESDRESSSRSSETYLCNGWGSNHTNTTSQYLSGQHFFFFRFFEKTSRGFWNLEKCE